METAFHALKEKLSQEVSLSFPDYTENAPPMELYVDASGVGAGACLIQKQNGKFKTIAYASMAFSKTAQHYSATERELEALRWGVKNFRSFLFGTEFVIHTDHKPLQYLHNMSRDNARLMRTINELEDYSYTIKYTPGTENQAADALSRIIEKDDACASCEESSGNEIPKGFITLKKIDGGGDTMFQSLLLTLEDLLDGADRDEIPSDHYELRRDLIEHILKYPSRFNIKFNKERKRHVKAMKHPGIIPCEAVLLAASDLYSVQIWVHHGMISPVVYKSESNEKSLDRIIHLQCISGVHFNPLTQTKKSNVKINEKCVNVCLQNRNDTIEDKNVTTDNVIHMFQEFPNDCSCPSDDTKRLMLCIGQTKFCCLMDTGAQISVITENIWNILKSRDNNLSLEATKSNIVGVGNQRNKILGVVNLSPDLFDIKLESEIPFAVIRSEIIPYCCILGNNFIKQAKIIIDFDAQAVSSEIIDEETRWYPFQTNEVLSEESENEFMGTMKLSPNEDEPDVSQLETTDYESEYTGRVRYVMDRTNYHDIQQNDHAISTLAEKIKSHTVAKLWKESFLFQYKRYQNELCLGDGILFRKYKSYNSIVVPFNLMVDILHKTHVQLCHIGRSKLIDITLKHFWHPSIYKVANDICTSCPHCQIFKVSRQHIKAPMLKIRTTYPFEIFAMDVMVLPKTKNGNVAVLVGIDHHTKWTTAIPIKNKKGSTISNALNINILPNLPKLPTKILSDNGPEFKSADFNEVLQNYNIEHVYSTPYKPTSNGCVERSNRTIVQLLRGIADGNENKWDEKLPHVLITHNSTIHSETGLSPSEYILAAKENIPAKSLINQESVDMWKVGHPKFSPYNVGQKILRKVQKKGNLASNKLRPIYDGVYEIVKVKPNTVTYDIQKINGQKRPILKVHYEQIKKFIELPDYLTDFIQYESVKFKGRLSESGSESSDSVILPYCAAFIVSSDLDISSEEQIKSNVDTNKEYGDTDASHMPNKIADFEDGTSSGSIITIEENRGPGRISNLCLSVRKQNSKKKHIYEKIRMEKSKVNQKSLELLPCSESIIENYEEKIIERLTSTPVDDGILMPLIITAKSLLPENYQAEGNEDISCSTQELMNVLCASEGDVCVADNYTDLPDKDQIRYIRDTDVWSMSSGSVDCDTSDSTNEIDLNKTIAMEQSYNSNQMIVCLRPTIENYTDICEKTVNINTICNEQSNSFVGFDVDKSHALVDRRLGNNQFIREIWKRKYLNSESRFQNSCSFSDSELLITPVLNFDSLETTPKIMTRSRGKPQLYPYIQKKPIEYNTRKN